MSKNKRPHFEGIGVTTPRSATMIALLGAKLDYEGLAFSGSEYEALRKLYGFVEEQPNERPPKPEFKPKNTAMTSWERDRELEDHKRAVKAWEQWQDPREFMQAGADRNLARHARNDGMRLIAWFAKYVDPGKDPLKALVQLAIDAGLDVDPSDVTWIEEQPQKKRRSKVSQPTEET